MRNRLICTLMALLALAGRATATGESVSVAAITVAPGDEALLDIDYSLPTSGTYVGFMFIVSLPEGLSLVEDPDDPGYPWYDDEVMAISKMNITTTAAGGFAATPKKASSTISGTSGVLMRLKVKADAGLTAGTYTGWLTEVSFNLRDDSYNVTKAKLSDVTFTLTVGPSGGLTLHLSEGWNWVSSPLQEPLSVDGLKQVCSRIVSQTEELVSDPQMGWVGTVTALQPRQCYKVLATQEATLTLDGEESATAQVALHEGWNWVGFAIAGSPDGTAAVGEAVAGAEEGDRLVGQDGEATYSGGQWTGTLTTLRRGAGYLYRSASAKVINR